MEESGLKPRCSDALPMHHLCSGLLPSVMKTREGARLFPRAALGEGPGPGLTFPSASELASGSGEGPGLPLRFCLPQGF